MYYNRSVKKPIQSQRLLLRPFATTDADDVFNCITPPITRFMPWEPPPSLSEYKAQRHVMIPGEDKTIITFVIRRRDTGECLGLTSLGGIDSVSPELGIWLKEAAHGCGYGREAIAIVAEWASKNLGKESFIYPVAVENLASRRIAEKLGGKIVGERTNPKYHSVVYEIPAPSSATIK